MDNKAVLLENSRDRIAVAEMNDPRQPGDEKRKVYEAVRE